MMAKEEAARTFARRAITEPAVPLERITEELSREPLMRARAQADLLIATSRETSAAAGRLDDLVEALATVLTVRPDVHGELTLVAQSLANAVLPLAHAVLVRDLAPTHPEILPLLEVADRVAPP